LFRVTGDAGAAAVESTAVVLTSGIDLSIN
jgi:ribose/xylose/arabinose/galactoside ABC-type transport system permease subunit